MDQVSSLFQKPTVEEIQQATPMRKRVRAKVLEEYEGSKALVPYVSKYKTSATFSTSLTQYTSFLDAELAWWNANIEVSPTQVLTRETKYDEKLPSLKDDLYTAMKDFFSDKPAPEIKDFIDKYPVAKDKPKVKSLLEPAVTQNMTAEEKAQKDLENRGWMEDIGDASKSVAKYLSIVIVILLALRWGSFAANEALWKDIPFRVLDFIYVTFISILYFPFALIYQIYKEVKSTPYFASLFPVVPMAEETADVGFFGYRVSRAFNEWKTGKELNFQEKLEELLSKTQAIYEETIQAKEEEMS
jgi:hypothetical protein